MAVLVDRFRGKLGGKPLRFVAVGALNSGFSFGLYSLLIYWGFGIALATLLALVAGIFFSFATQGTLVFKNATPTTFVRYVVAWVVLYFCNLAITGCGVWLGLNPYYAGAAAILPTAALSYFVLDRFVFSAGTGRSAQA
ncbi:MAG TPA: GtrA family protein [Roseateles sp.]